jgi:O-antigen/teichoic acid export membrane protein
LRRGLVLFAAGALLLCLCAPVLLALFGSRYADESGAVLRLFALAVVPKFVVTVYVAVSRVQRRVGRIVLVQSATSVLVLSLALLTMPAWGVVGVAGSYLAAQVAACVAVLPRLARTLRGVG